MVMFQCNIMSIQEPFSWSYFSVTLCPSRGQFHGYVSEYFQPPGLSLPTFTDWVDAGPVASRPAHFPQLPRHESVARQTQVDHPPSA